MSAIAACTDGRRALIVCDTEAFGPHGVPFDAAKIHILPTIGVVFAVRGTLGVGLNLYQKILGSRLSVDELLERMPELMDEALKISDAMPQAAVEMIGKCQVIMAAWSLEMEAMTLHHYCITAGKVQANRCVDNVIAPGDGVPLDGITATRAGMIELAERQVHHLREVHPTCAAGGRFIVCELTRDTLTIETESGIPARTVQPGSKYVPDERLMQQAIREAYANPWRQP